MDDSEPIVPKTVRFVSTKGKYLLIVVCVVVLAAAGTAYYYYDKATRTQDPQAVAQEEAKKLVEIVGKLMMLPKDELPIIATVADPEKLKGQPFFQNATKGDKVLIYNVARKAILYNPESNKIVDVAPLTIGQSNP